MRSTAVHYTGTIDMGSPRKIYMGCSYSGWGGVNRYRLYLKTTDDPDKTTCRRCLTRMARLTGYQKEDRAKT